MRPLGQADLNPIHFGRITKTEMETHITVRDISVSAPHIVNHLEIVCVNRYPRADTIPVGLSANGLEHDPVLFFAEVFQEARSFILIDHKYFQTAVIINIPQSGSS